MGKVGGGMNSTELNLDTITADEARALHRVVRAMHDGHCPNCGWRGAAEKFQTSGGDLSCPNCGWAILATEAQAALDAFRPFMAKNRDVFEKWFGTRTNSRGEIFRMGKKMEVVVNQVRMKTLEDENRRRVYYQDIVYAVCNILDRRFGSKSRTVCGTVSEPSTEVQDRCEELVRFDPTNHHNAAKCPHCNPEHQKRVEENDNLRAAIKRAGFSVMQTSGDWSICDVSEYGKQQEAKTLEVATENVDLKVALKKCRDFLENGVRCSTSRSELMSEINEALGDES